MQKNVPMFTVTVGCKPTPIVQKNLSKYASKDFIKRMTIRYPDAKIKKVLQENERQFGCGVIDKSARNKQEFVQTVIILYK
jgi:ribosome biogenesis protein Nip4